MKRFFPILWMVFGLTAPGSAGQTEATEQDLTELQAELQNLEAELEAAGARGTKLSSDLRARIETIREDATYLKVTMRKHQQAGGSGTGVLRDEVEDLEIEIRSVRDDLRSHRPQVREGARSVEVGTTLSVRLLDSLGSQTSEPGDSFRGSVAEPVTVGGDIAIPAGAVVEGTVETVERPRSRTDRSSRLVLAFRSVSIDGESFPLDATVVDASEDLETGIGDEVAKIGGSAGIGAVLGAVLGGDEGAVIGGVIGGAGAILGTEGKDVFLPRGTVLELRLDGELKVAPTGTSG
jgi:hypothetical protein